MGLSFFTNKANLNNHISNHIEISFTKHGPTLGLSGVLTSFSHVVFVQNIALNLLRKKDNQQYLFDWFAFRPTQYNIKGYSDIDLKMPTKFMVASNQSYKYNILFIDQNMYAEMNPYLKEIKRNWQKTLEQANFDIVVDKYQEIFDGFSRKEDALRPLQRLQELSYWEEGEYTVTIIITTRDKKYLEMKKTFLLNKENLDILEQNSIVILHDLCKQPGVTYQTISSELK